MKKFLVTLGMFGFMTAFAYMSVQAFGNGRLLLGWTLGFAFLWCAVMATALVMAGDA